MRRLKCAAQSCEAGVKEGGTAPSRRVRACRPTELCSQPAGRSQTVNAGEWFHDTSPLRAAAATPLPVFAAAASACALYSPFLAVFIINHE